MAGSIYLAPLVKGRWGHGDLKTWQLFLRLVKSVPTPWLTADGGTHSAAPDGYPQFHLPHCHGSSQGNDEIGIIVVGVQGVSVQIDYLMACGSKLGDELFLQTKPTMISSDSHLFGKTDCYQETSLSFR
jgi:hypothetical protein